jgi:predicted dehydrogenase
VNGYSKCNKYPKKEREMQKKHSRRLFMKRSGALSAAIGIPTIIPSYVLKGEDAPSNKVNIAGIGVGGMGFRNILQCSRSANIVALCDVDHKYAGHAFKKYPEAKTYKDFRVMLEKQKDIDAVLIATPDHTHASIAIAAMQSGKHVFCQKPLTHDVYESRVLTQAAEKYDVVTQMGIQGHSQEGIRLITEWVRDGAIGTVREAEAWCSLMYSPPGHAYWSSPLQERPQEGESIPSGLDWNQWIGPAPMRPYHSCYHPGSWRGWWAFGCGWMGDRGAHTIDPIYTALQLGAPTSVEASGVVGGNSEFHPDQSVVEYHFPERNGLPPLKLTWYEGQEPPRPESFEADREFPKQGGLMLKGDKGMIMAGVYGGSPRLIPESAMRAYNRPPKTIPRVKGSHEEDWITAIREGGKAGADFGYSGPLTEAALLGNVAKRFPGEKLKWDASDMQVTNHAEANDWIKRPRRKGWRL